MNGRGAAAAAFVVATTSLCCARVPVAGRAEAASDDAAHVPASERALEFEYQGTDGKLVRAVDLRGRMTFVGFIATYDMASQAQTRFLATVVRTHKPRLNGLLIALEPRQNEPLVRAFAAAMDLPVAVAMADTATLAGRGPFPGLHHVPSILLLDRDGREVWRHLGMANVDELETAVTVHEAR